MNPVATQQEVGLAHDMRIAQALGRGAIDRATEGAVRNFLEEVNRGPRTEQYKDDDVVVKVSSGYSKKYRRATTDVIIALRNVRDGHMHIVFLDDGTEVHREWTGNH